MNKLLLIILFPLSVLSQKDTTIRHNNIATISLELGAGYLQGWREEVLYHPNALLKHFPHLNKNFWDNRISWHHGGIFDANHVLKFEITMCHITALSLHFQNKRNWKKVLLDIAKHYVAYQIGFFLSYNLTLKNKL